MADPANPDTTSEDRAEGDGWYSNEAATFGDRLAGAREALGLSQGDLAHKLGIEPAMLEAWENDVTEPRASRLQFLSGVLNVSLMWLLNGEGEGLSEPGGADLPADVTGLLSEVRQIRGIMAQSAERLAGVEKRLQRALREAV